VCSLVSGGRYITPCDPIWQVKPRSSEMSFIKSSTLLNFLNLTVELQATRKWICLLSRPPLLAIGINVSPIYSSVSSCDICEQNKLWQELSSCRQAKFFLHGFYYSRALYALNLARKYLRILVGLLTGHADLNLHFTSWV